MHNPLKLCALTLASTAMLSACSTSQAPETRETVTQVISVPLEPQDTPEFIKSHYGSEIIVWSEDMAVLAVEQGELFTVGTRKNSKNEVVQEVVESNKNVFSAGGMATMNGSTAWANGSTAWANGSTAWANGEFILIPQNTAAWQQIKLEQAHQLAPNLGYGIKVAVIDTGVDLQHPAIVKGLAPSSDWKDYVDNDDVPQEVGTLGQDGYGHGTSVAGIIRQIAPAAQIMPIRILSSDGSGNISDLALAITWAVDHGADIINLSLGSDTSSDAVRAAINYATNNKVIVVSSVGNTGTKEIAWPARRAFESKRNFFQLSVTSVDANDIKSSFASYHWKVELAAPGEDIFGPAPDMRMASWSGTSMAAPVASAALALALGENQPIPKANLTDKLLGTSIDLYNNSMNAAFNDLIGQGRIDIKAFLVDILQSSTDTDIPASNDDSGDQNGDND